MIFTERRIGHMPVQELGQMGKPHVKFESVKVG